VSRSDASSYHLLRQLNPRFDPCRLRDAGQLALERVQRGAGAPRPHAPGEDPDPVARRAGMAADEAVRERRIEVAEPWIDDDLHTPQLMNATRLRVLLILVLAAAAIVSVVGQKTDSPAIGWVSFALFLVAVALYFQWRRAVHVARGKVFDREAKTSDEARARTDK
jgi:hypothetical protein